MIVYKITTEKYAEQLSSSGAANRWNVEGEFVIYCAETRSLASLELVVHRAAIRPKVSYKVLVIEIDVTKTQIAEVQVFDLPNEWRSVAAYNTLQSIGSAWYVNRKKLVMRIPSAIIPQENNYMIHTKHKLFENKVKILNVEDFFWDERLL